jgi:hypothetical protein
MPCVIDKVPYVADVAITNIAGNTHVKAQVVVPANEMWELDWILAEYVASATVGSRIIIPSVNNIGLSALTFATAGFEEEIHIGERVSITAGQAFHLSWLCSEATINGSAYGTDSKIYMLQPTFLIAGDVLRLSDVDDVATNDTVRAMLHYRLYYVR